MARELNLVRNLQSCPCLNGSRLWSDDELALLGTMTDNELAHRTGRSVNGVRVKRTRGSVASADDRRRLPVFCPDDDAETCPG